MTSLTIFLVTLLAHSYCVKLPHNFKTCHKSQPDFHKCLRVVAEYNIHHIVHPYKDLRLPGLKPLKIPTLVIGSGKRAVAVEQHFSNCNLYGLDHVELAKFDFEFDNKRLILDGHFTEFTKKCNYELSGRVLLLPIQGKGESTIVIQNMTIAGYLDFVEVKRSEKTYLHFTSHNLSLEVGHVYFHFDNLFNGDRVLGDNINKLLNDNWSEVFEDVKSNYAAVVNEIILSLFDNFWSKVSVEEAFNPE